MRITFLLPCYPWVPIGGFRVVYEYANKLVDRGHNVSVVHARRTRYSPRPAVSNLRGAAREAKNWLRERLVRPAPDWQTLDKRIQMLFVPRAEPKYIPDGDVLFATAWHTVAPVLESPDRKGKKLYLVQHYETWEGSKDLVDATWRAPIHKVVIAKWLFEIGKGLGCQDMTYIPYGLDHGRYRLLTPIEDRRPRVAMMFSTLQFKASADGVAALRLAKQRYPDVEVVLFGVSRRPPSLSDWAEYYENPPQEFLVKEIYNASSVFICSSLSEGFFLPAAEAACCGCAIVSTDNGGIRDYVQHEVAGLLSPPGEPKLLGENLCRLLGDEALRVRLAKACREFLLPWTWEDRALRLERLLLDLLNEKVAEPLRVSVQPS